MEIWIGVAVFVVGTLLCFWGNRALRVLIAIWGALVGAFLAAALVADITGQEAFGTPLTWVAAVVGAVLCGLLAYWLYAAAVIIWMGSLGYLLGTRLTLGLGAPGTAATAAGIAAAVLLIILAIATRLPALLLIVASALTGSFTMLVGILLMIGSVDVETDPASAQGQWWWTAGYLVLAAIGGVYQWRSLRTRDVRGGTQWASQ